MLRSLLASAFVCFCGASRIQVHDSGKSEANFGATCEDLQTTFHNRLVSFQTFLDATDLDAMSRTAQVRIMSRTYGIIRPLRRARTCDWVIANDSQEIEQARGIVQTLLAGNPCTDAARSELQAGTHAETAELEVQSLGRALSVLTSDDCEVGAQSEETATADEDVEVQLRNAEDDVQDLIEDAADSQEGAFIQTTDSKVGFFRRFLRGLAVAFLMLVLLLACASAAAVITAFVAAALIYFVEFGGFILNTPAGIGTTAGYGGLFFGAIGGVVGLASCSYQLYTQLLPRLTQ